VENRERRLRIIRPNKEEVVAHHEAGHALVAESREHADKVYKISIIRGVQGLTVPWRVSRARLSKAGRHEAEQLQRDGTRSFDDSWDDLLGCLASRAETIGAVADQADGHGPLTQVPLARGDRQEGSRYERSTST
jgi:hypothetical protein